jgi:hypothetical protein
VGADEHRAWSWKGLARKVATGASVNENDAGFLGMRADLIKQRPDVVKAWLNAELDAQLFFADPKNAMEVVKMAREQTTGFSERALWMSAYGTYPKEGGGTPTRIILPYAFTPEAMELIKRSSAFLHEIKSINTPQLRPEAGDAGIRSGGPQGAWPHRTARRNKTATRFGLHREQVGVETFVASRARGDAGGSERGLVSFGRGLRCRSHQAGRRLSTL